MNIVNDPIQELQQWLAEAKEKIAINYNAVALASVDAEGTPDVRYVLLKKIHASGIEFFTNRGSAKAGQLLANPNAALAMYWREIEKQVRVRGSITELGRDEVAAYFATRSRDSQLGAWASYQSQPLASIEELKEKVSKTAVKFKDEDQITPPDYWTGFLLVPSAIEFWQQGEARLHERVRYKRSGSSWQHERLYP